MNLIVVDQRFYSLLELSLGLRERLLLLLRPLRLLPPPLLLLLLLLRVRELLLEVLFPL